MKPKRISNLTFGLVFFLGGVALLVIPDFEWSRLIVVGTCAVFGFIFVRAYFRSKKSE